MGVEKDFSELLNIAVEFLKLVSGELDEYTTDKGKIEISGNEVSLFTPAHIQFAKYGRGAGTPPPFQSIFDFVKKNGIQFEGQDQEGTAWAIVKSIAKNGTINHVPNAPNAIEEAITLHYAAYNENMSEKFRIIIQDDIKAAYTNLPALSEFRI